MTYMLCVCTHHLKHLLNSYQLACTKLHHWDTFKFHRPFVRIVTMIRRGRSIPASTLRPNQITGQICRCPSVLDHCGHIDLSNGDATGFVLWPTYTALTKLGNGTKFPVPPHSVGCPPTSPAFQRLPVAGYHPPITIPAPPCFGPALIYGVWKVSPPRRSSVLHDT